MKLQLCVAALAAAVLAVFPAEAGQGVLTSTIDYQCHFGGNSKLTVAAGGQASGFTLHGLASGTKCVVGGAIEDRGFSISGDWFDANQRYHQGEFYCYIYQRGTTVETVKGHTYPPTSGDAPQHLSEVVLGPGNYYVGVSGGSGAGVTLYYNATP